MSDTLYATFNDASLAEKAIGALLDHGVRNEDISVISRDTHLGYAEGNRRDDDRAAEARHGVTVTSRVDAEGTDIPANHEAADGEHVDKAGKRGLSTSTAGDAEAGAAKGAGIGLGVGVAAAIASLVVPGFGLVLGGGALATALAGTAGATAAGAVAGGVTGYLKDQGIPDDAATDYDRAYRNGSAVLSVHVPSGKLSRGEVEGLLAKYHADYVHTYAGMVH
jgi:hypothetical protein